MNIEIHSFQSALHLKPHPNEKTAMIRISDPDYAEERDAELYYRSEYADVLKVSFHDLTDKKLVSVLEKEPEAPYRTITYEQAEEIVAFFKKHQDCDVMVIHCSGGISRSSAVAIGLARFFKDEMLEKNIRESDFYFPNETVVERLTEALQRTNKGKED